MMKPEDYAGYKSWVLIASVTAVIYQVIVAVHFLLLYFRPEMNVSFMLSVEVLYCFAWFGYCMYKKVHELSGKVPFASGFAVLYLIWKYSPIVMRRIGIESYQRIGINIMITIEAVFVFMIAIILFVKNTARKETD